MVRYTYKYTTKYKNRDSAATKQSCEPWEFWSILGEVGCWGSGWGVQNVDYMTDPIVYLQKNKQTNKYSSLKYWTKSNPFITKHKQ